MRVFTSHNPYALQLYAAFPTKSEGATPASKAYDIVTNLNQVTFPVGDASHVVSLDLEILRLQGKLEENIDGDLYRQLVSSLVHQTLIALAEVHRADIFHSDIKLPNIMLSGTIPTKQSMGNILDGSAALDLNVVIIDFGGAGMKKFSGQEQEWHHYGSRELKYSGTEGLIDPDQSILAKKGDYQDDWTKLDYVPLMLTLWQLLSAKALPQNWDGDNGV